jgi:hypothetical protein
LPLRRHLFADWYQPVARIDEELFDRYPLHEDDEEENKDDAGRKMSLFMEFRAKRSGRLYLYLNDAALFLPGLVEFYYDNNNGYACVTVTELGEVATEQDGPATEDQPSLAEGDVDPLACGAP